MDALVEILAQIKHSKDENGSRYGVKRLAELIRGEKGFVDRLVAKSPEQEELFHLWDLGLVKNASPQYSENLCFVFESILRDPGKAGDFVGEQLIHPRRIRIVYSLLSSGNRTKISCGLILMACIADRGARHVTRILSQFDFSLNALKVVGVPPKVSGGKMINAAAEEGDGSYARTLWKSDELSKRPTRVAFLQFFKSMLSNCDELRLPFLLSMKYFLGNAMHYVSRDPYDAQWMLLAVIKTRIIEQPWDVLTPPTKAAVFSEKFITQLLSIVQRVGEDDEIEHVAQEADLLLTRILTDPSLGVADRRVHLQQCLFYNHLGYARRSKRRVLKVLLGMKPGKCHRLFTLIRHVFECDPVMALLYLSEMPLDVDPKETSSFASNSSIAIIAFDSVLKGLKDSQDSVDTFDEQVLLGNWKAVMSSKITKASLSRGLQHAAPFVGHTSAIILGRLLEILGEILVLLENNDRKEGVDCSAADRLRQMGRKSLPDIQLIVAYHGKICDYEDNTQQRSLRRSASLNLLKMWVMAFPESLSETNVQMDKLVPDSIGTLHPENQMEYLSLLHIASAHIESYTISPKFEVILRLSLHHRKGGNDGMLSQCHKWLVQQLCSTRIFCQGVSGVLNWINNLPTDSDFVLDFFVDALKATIRRPSHYFDILCKSCQETRLLDGVDIDPSEVTPLFACAVQRTCRILKSKRDAKDKSQVISFMKDVVLNTLLISVKPYSYLAVFKFILEQEIPQETLSMDTKKRRHSIVQHYLAGLIPQLCQDLQQDSYEWIVSAVVELDASNVQRDKKRSKSCGHSNSHVEQGAWALYAHPLSRTLSCIFPTRPKHCIAFDLFASHNQHELRTGIYRSSPDPNVDQFMTCLQHFLLFGRPESIASATANIIDSIKKYLLYSKEETIKCLEAFYGQNASSFWEYLGARLDKSRDMRIVRTLEQIIQTLACIKSGSKDSLHSFAISKYASSGWRQIMQSRIWESSCIVLSRLIEQCQSCLDCLTLDDVLSCITELIKGMFRSNDFDGFYASTDAVCDVFVKKLQHMPGKIDLEVVSNVAHALSEQIDEHGTREINGRHVPLLSMYCRLYAWTESEEKADAGLVELTSSIVDILFLHLDNARSVAALTAISSKIDLNLLENGLIKSLEKAKLEETKYKRRLELARLVPILDQFLSIQSELLPNESTDTVVYQIFLKVLVQFIFSKKELDVMVSSDEEVKAFNTMQVFLVPAVQKLLHLQPWSMVAYQHITAFLEKSPKKAFTEKESVGNPRLSNKVNVLAAFAQTIRDASQPNLTDVDIPQFICQSSIWTIRVILMCLKNVHEALAPSLELLNILGDLLAEFTEGERQTQHFKDLAACLTKEFLPTILTIFPKEVDIWIALRRFTAALLPQEDDNQHFSMAISSELENDIYRDIASAFFSIITHNSLLECFQGTKGSCSAISDEYLANHLPLGSLMGCVSLSVSNSCTVERENMPGPVLTIKKEICEIVETLLDLLSSMESHIAQGVLSEYSESFKTGEKALLQFLLASYGASLSATDMAVWSLIKCLNERAWRREEGSLSSGGEGSVKYSMDAIMKGPISEHRFCWGKGASQNRVQLSPLKSAILAANFPEWRHLIGSDRLPDKVIVSEIPPEYRMNYEESAYDPSFLLPMCLYSIRNGMLECRDIIDSLLLPVLLRSLGSADVYIRGIAMECLSLLEGKDICTVTAEEKRQDIDRLKIVLGWVRNSIETPFQRMLAMHAIHAAETSVVLFNPTSLMYSNVSKSFTKAPQVDCNSVPQVLKQLLKKSSDWSERHWLQKMLICGLRTSNDVFLYLRSHIFEIAMCTASSLHEDTWSKQFCLVLLERAAHIPKAARVMAESCGLSSWLVMKIIDESRSCLELRSDGMLDSIHMSLSAWKAMCSWKSVTRGSRKDRYHSSEDLMLSANRIHSMLLACTDELLSSHRGRQIYKMLQEVNNSMDL